MARDSSESRDSRDSIPYSQQPSTDIADPSIGPKLTKQSRIDLGTPLNQAKTDLMDSVLNLHVDLRLWGIVYGLSLTRVCALGIEEGNF